MIGLSGEETARLSKEFGLPTVIKVTDQALKIFKEIRLAQDGHLSLEEFAKALGHLGAKSPGDGQRSLASFMFSAIDTNDSGTLSFAEFVEWMLTMLSGTTERKRRFGFDLCDADGDGLIQRSEIAALLSSIFGVLSGLSLGDHNPDEQLFLDELFGKFGEGGETLSWEQWQRACTEWSDTILHLGHTRHVGERLGAGRTHEVLAEEQQEEEGKREQKGEVAFFGQERWEFMLTLMLALQLAIDKAEPQDQADTAELFHTWSTESAAEKAAADAEGRDAVETPQPVPERIYELPSPRPSEPAPQKTGLFGRARSPRHGPPPKVTVYGGQLFREIRAASGVSDAEILGALGIRQVLGALLMGDLRGLGELVSEGKSGSLFFWSHDGKYMVKTIDVAERDSLRSMLRAYNDHLQAHPSSLLTKYLGLYTLELPAHDDQYHLVIMRNVFWTELEIEERFDLKGSTHGRTVGEEDKHNKELVRKDLDWSTMGRRIGIAEELVPKLQMQLGADAAFLSAQSVIDYSLLVGVARRPGLDAAARERWEEEHRPELEAAYSALVPGEPSTLRSLLCTEASLDTTS